MSQGSPYPARERVRDALGVVRDYDLDENLGDTSERFETLLWILSAGTEGRDWGIRESAEDGPWTFGL